MGSNYRMDYDVDIVFCIDATGSMGMEHILDTVKQNALNFYDDFKACMEKKNKKVANLRVRAIAFRDYLDKDFPPMLITDFYDLPSEAADFRHDIEGIEACGGEDDPEDGLEALSFAIKTSEWRTTAPKRRHVIVVWSDEGTHPLGFGSSSPKYDTENIARDFNELTEWWGSNLAPGIMDEKAKRLVLFTPDKPGWSTIRDNWNNVVWYESEAGRGLEDLDYKQILNIVSNTV